MTTDIGQAFDYTGCDAGTIKFGQETEQLAMSYMISRKRTITEGLELGSRLIEMKRKLPHGRYMSYLQSIGLPKLDAYFWRHKVEEAQAQNSNVGNLNVGDFQLVNAPDDVERLEEVDAFVDDENFLALPAEETEQPDTRSQNGYHQQAHSNAVS